MSQFPEFDERRINRYAAVGTGLLMFVEQMTLHTTLEWASVPTEHGWGRIIFLVVVPVSAFVAAQIGAKWLVRRYPTTHAYYD